MNETRFLDALDHRMPLPGPEARMLATYAGWLPHGTPGGLAAGIPFVLPGFVPILLLDAPFPLIMLGVGLIGSPWGRIRPDPFLGVRGHAPSGATGPGIGRSPSEPRGGGPHPGGPVSAWPSDSRCSGGSPSRSWPRGRGHGASE